MEGLLLLAVLLGIYFLPTIVAWQRKVPNTGSIAVINLFLGWTLIGWVVALAMAVRTIPRAEEQVTAPAVSRKPKGIPAKAGESKPRGNTVSQIGELADLHDRGVLTDDEYGAAKTRLLNR